MTDLAERRCVACRGDQPALAPDAIAALKEQLSDAWTVIDAHHLVRRFDFPDFSSALAFVNLVGGVAEEEDHHPDLLLGWGRVEVRIWTHVVDGLSENDFILAAKIDRLAQGDPNLKGKNE